MDHPARNSFDAYYMSLVEIKYFIALNDNKPFPDHPLKTNKKCLKIVLVCQIMMSIQQETY